MYLTNALPASVLATAGALISFEPVSPRMVGAMLENGTLQSAVGHQDTANLISATCFGAPCPFNRVSIQPLLPGESLIAALYQGPRLEEGSKTLPEGASLSFFRVRRVRETSEYVNQDLFAYFDPITLSRIPVQV